MRSKQNNTIIFTDSMTGDNIIVLHDNEPITFDTILSVVKDCFTSDYYHNQHGIHITYGIE